MSKVKEFYGVEDDVEYGLINRQPINFATWSPTALTEQQQSELDAYIKLHQLPF